MTWEIAVAGTVHSDEIVTPAGGRPDQLGGSAVYFALAAVRYAPVHLNGIVGSDRADAFLELLGDAGVGVDGLVISELPTFRWHARHDFDSWAAVDTSSEEGADPTWRPALSAASVDAPVLFLASMRPSLQSEVSLQSRATMIGSDSMIEYTGPHAHAVGAVARSSDVIFLTRAELASLTGTEDHKWREAAVSVCGDGRLRAVVVKAGPDGAACVTATSVVERPAAPVVRVVDPTGAGDALAGGFLGACAAAERDDVDFFADALDAGLASAAAAISGFGLEGLITESPRR
ncbi:MAG TPA: PfkB family carbohydrate kinase [Candidatus Dormibacteraeota bacterium]|jgi:sugar/nucleoside kinase (ribokinase family)